jgi:amino acid transporter
MRRQTSVLNSEGPSNLIAEKPRQHELVKSIRWWDGFALGLAVPGFMLPSLGPSIAALGAIGAIFIWAVSVLLGALQNKIYAELATMMPGKSGGIGIYANEAMKGYTRLVGPLVVWGYWFGWSSVLSIYGLLVGNILTKELWPGANVNVAPPLIGTVMLICLWVFNLRGLRPGVWLSYLLGALTTIPILVIIFVPFLNGSFRPNNLLPLALPGHVTWFSWSSLSLMFYWLYIAGWSAYGFECVATFTPEYKDTLKDTPRALRSSALFSVLVYCLAPLAVLGVLGQAKVQENVYTAFAPALKITVGNSLGALFILLLVASFVLSANLATLDGSRALWQMSKDRMTITGLGHLNKRGVPAVAMTVDLFVQVALMWLFPAGPSAILAASNLGYILCHIFALIGFILLRRDQPRAERPFRLSRGWIPISGTLAALNTSFILIGSWRYGLRALGIGTLILVSGLVLYLFRIRVQDRRAEIEAPFLGKP